MHINGRITDYNHHINMGILLIMKHKLWELVLMKQTLKFLLLLNTVVLTASCKLALIVVEGGEVGEVG
jgi:hypothetical protein